MNMTTKVSNSGLNRVQGKASAAAARGGG